jgi:polyphosphate kinase
MINSSSLFINREISWLHFNGRVLQEAVDKANPLIERLKFLGIFSNNRDEFFRVRVGTINRMLNVKNLDYKIKFDPKEVLSEINKIVIQQEEDFTNAYREIVDELKEDGIYIINEKQLSAQQGVFVKQYFNDNIWPHLFPIMLNNIHHENSLIDSSLYLLVDLQSENEEIENNQAIIKIPTDNISRFLILPKENGKQYILLLDDAIRHCLSDIFSILGYDTYNAYTIKFTRDAELDIDNDVAKSFMAIMTESIKKRKRGVPVRFVYEETIPPGLLKKLIKKLKISENDNLRSGGRYHNFKDFMSFPHIGPDHLYYPPMPPLPHRDLPHNKSILDAVRKRDIMLHFPYQSFHYIIDLLREASVDPRVKAVKMTFYRTAKHSMAMNALINAARNGKQVTVFMEIQARFDEEANIYWTNRLQEEGVKIIQTIPGFKVHSKLILISRLEDGEEIYYANISTGNFNESTARVYADDSLLTADQSIATDVDKVFKLFETRYHPPEFESLIVSPFQNRDFFMRMLNNEIRNREEGKDAWAIIKLNSLVDRKIVRKLYQASEAGVKIQLIIRGLSVIKPGVSGLSDNIDAFGVVDRFLEHSRVYVFCNDNDNKYYISSADWMQRNFDHRIEVTCPINDKNIQKELWTMLQIQLQDNCKARLLDVDDINRYKKTSSKKKFRSQFETYKFFNKL